MNPKNTEKLYKAICDRDFSGTKKLLNHYQKGEILKLRFKFHDPDDMIREDDNQETYECDIVSLIRMLEKNAADKQWPASQLLYFKAILDCVALKEGGKTDGIVKLWKNPVFGCREGDQWTPIKNVPTSPQMSGYLGHLEDMKGVDEPLDERHLRSLRRKELDF